MNANGDLIGYNMYACCSNNPVMYTDPSGESFWVAVAIGAVAGLLGQGITDAAISLDRGELYVSSWQSFLRS